MLAEWSRKDAEERAQRAQRNKQEAQEIIAFSSEALRDEPRQELRHTFRQRRQSLSRRSPESKLGLIGEEMRIADELQTKRSKKETRRINAFIRARKDGNFRSKISLACDSLRNSLRDSLRASQEGLRASRDRLRSSAEMFERIEDLQRMRHPRSTVAVRLNTEEIEGDDDQSDFLSARTREWLVDKAMLSEPEDEEEPVHDTAGSGAHEHPSQQSRPHLSVSNWLALMEKLDLLTLNCAQLQKHNDYLKEKLKDRLTA